MPWCEECAKYLTPNSMKNDGTCPKCDNKVEAAPREVLEGESAPWHFKLMVVALVAYLVYRVVQFF